MMNNPTNIMTRTDWTVIISALLKQVPAKAKRSESGLYYICPVCNKFIERNESAHGNIDIPFCKWCGQKLEWEEQQW